MSPVLFEVLKMVRKRFAKVVFTTNGGPVKGGLNLISRHEIGDRVAQFIDFLNISRHHFDDRKNSAIFGTKMMPIINIPAAINRFNKAGVPVTANCVLGHPSSMDIYDYMFRMRSAGFSSICFRKPHVEGCDLLPTQQESMFRDYKVIEHSECPVCRSDTQLIRGMNVIWTASIPEPMDGMDGVVYEAVFHPDGKLTADWSKNIEIEL